LEKIERHMPEDLAKSITIAVSEIFRRICLVDFHDAESKSLKRLAVNSSILRDDITACLIADSSLAPYMITLAEVWLISMI
jgi:hypothetical protein